MRQSTPPIDDTDPIRKLSIDLGSPTTCKTQQNYFQKVKPIQNFSIDHTSLTDTIADAVLADVSSETPRNEVSEIFREIWSENLPRNFISAVLAGRKVFPPKFHQIFPIRDFKFQIKLQTRFRPKFSQYTSAGMATLTMRSTFGNSSLPKTSQP